MPFLALPGPTELYIILLAILLIFGARKLPELARAMGSSINQFKKGLRDEEQGPDLLEGRTRETEDRA
jgi:sec-independent protein translocase protein TatA